MDIFEVHRQIMDDYAKYIRGFVSIADREIRERVERYLDDGQLWPEPLLTQTLAGADFSIFLRENSF